MLHNTHTRFDDLFILNDTITKSNEHRVTIMTDNYYIRGNIINKARMEAVEYVFAISCYEKTKSIIDMILNIRAMNPSIVNKIGFSLHISQRVTFSDEVDYFIYNKLTKTMMFPKDYNVTVRNDGNTKGVINLIKALKYGLDTFKKAKYFILLSGDCMQIKHSPKFLHYPVYGFGVDYSATIQVRYQMTPDNKYYEHKFIRRIYELNNGSCVFAYGQCDGISMKRDLAEDFTNIWYHNNTYKNYDEMINDNNVKFIDAENYVFATYLCNLKNKVAGLGLCSRLCNISETTNDVNSQNINTNMNTEMLDYITSINMSNYFIGPVSKHINTPIRKNLREKYGYNQILKDIISSINNDDIDTYHPRPILLYKQTKTKYYSGELCNYDIFELDDDKILQGNQPRVIYIEFKTNTSNDVCLFASGEPRKNNCFNIMLSKIICIVCLANNINEYHASSLNDNLWHKLMVIVGINKVSIYVDDIQILVRRHDGINTKGNRCIIGGSNVVKKPQQNHFEGYMRNFFYFSGFIDPNYESSYFDDVKNIIHTNAVYETDYDITLDSIGDIRNSIILDSTIHNNIILDKIDDNIDDNIDDITIDNTTKTEDIKTRKKHKKDKKHKKYKKHKKHKNYKETFYGVINSDSDTDTIEIEQ